MGEIHELFVLALSLVWFAGATPESGACFYGVSHRCACARGANAPFWGAVNLLKRYRAM